jgi:pimeloyl-ACP methyl ester carboxylesterase
MLRHRQVHADGLALHAVESGPAGAPAVVLLHGWPEDASAFEPVMHTLALDAHVVALDLPGVGGSETPAPSNDKRTLAQYVHLAVEAMHLEHVTLVGHDVGGMVTYAYLREFPHDLARAVIMDTVIPGVEPWSEIEHNPDIWHFGFHAVPALPERLVSGRQAAYFGFFYDALAARPLAIDQATRIRHVEAYVRPLALHTGFEWYRAFPRDEEDNRRALGQPVRTPLLYLRGDHDPGLDVDRYVEGLRSAGVTDVAGAVIAGSGHFAPEEQPAAVAATLKRFIAEGD